MYRYSGKKKATKYDSEIKKLKKLYENYGINTSDMSEEEFERLYNQYVSSGKNINKDLKDSEQYSKAYDDDIIG